PLIFDHPLSGMAPPTPSRPEASPTHVYRRPTMTATGAPQGVTAPDLGTGGLLFVDVKIRSALIAEGRRRAITRVFGISRDVQSWLVTTILCGAGALVVRDAVAGRLHHPSGSDVAIGGALLNAMG